MQKLFAAVDLGASSGRVISGLLSSGKLKLKELHRFPNKALQRDGLLVWDFEKLMTEIRAGLVLLNREAEELGLHVHSIGIDTWAVDYGLLKDGELLAPPNCYRDPGNGLGVESVHRKVSFEELYSISGLQFLPFNSLYQIARQQQTEPGLIESADSIVMLPDLVAYFLTGRLRTERTNASSTGLLDARTRSWDIDLAARLGIDLSKFPELSDAGTELGPIKGDFGPMLERAKVVLVGSHDTASAVVGTPSAKPGFAFLSSGTWSLLGAEIAEPILTPESMAANFTNELGVDDRVRYLKNLSGLWLLSESIRDLEQEGQDVNLGVLLDHASGLNPSQRLDVNDPEFISPGDMLAKIRHQLDASHQPSFSSMAELVAIILHSLAASYSENFDRLQELTGMEFDSIYLIGGGVQNALLCQLTANYTKTKVIAGPIEATAIGNILIQARAAGDASSTLESLRDVIIGSDFGITEFSPR